MAQVKGAELDLCKGVTVEQMVDKYFDSPSWESGVSDKGVKFVNVSGGMSYHDKPVRGEIQFTFTKDGKRFEFNAFEINGVPQMRLMGLEVLRQMCVEANKN